MKGRSHWDATCHSISNWNWRRFLKLKEIVARSSVGNIITSKILEDIGVKNSKISWHKLGLNDDATCLFCDKDDETKDHIFFECSYSKKILEMVLQLCNIGKVVGSWSQELAWAFLQSNDKSLMVAIPNLVWNAYIYTLWREGGGNRVVHEVKDLGPL